MHYYCTKITYMRQCAVSRYFDCVPKVRQECQLRKSKFREVVAVFVIVPSRGSLLRENRLTKRKRVVVDASGQATYRSNEWTWLPLSPPR